MSNAKGSVDYLLITIVLFSLVLVSNVDASTSIVGIINSDTTWTKAGSPYVLEGPVAVNKGVTLTIQPGVTVNLNGYYIQVNGTLIARGTDNDKIYFVGGSVRITSISQQTGQASVYEYTVTDQLSVEVSMTITRNYFKELGAGGAATVSQNTIERVTITGNEIYTKNTWARIFVSGSHADISDNIIIGNPDNKPSGITISGIHSSATITGNQIYNCQTGVDIRSANAKISKNVIANSEVGVTFSIWTPTIEIGAPWDKPTTVEITSNTISRNTIGIQVPYYNEKSTISNNNIYDNSQYNFKLSQSQMDVTASSNWWGTVDPQQISQKIFDQAKDFNLGKVNFTPFLTAPNPQAPTIPTNIPSMPTPTPAATPTSPTDSPGVSPSPGQESSALSGVEVAILVVLIVIAVLLVVLIVTLRRRR